MINIKVCKEAYSDSGRVVQIDNDGTIVVSSVRTSVGMTQTGSGTPSTSNKRPIVRWNDVVTHRSNSEDDAGTEYTTDLGRDGITAFEIDVIKGEVTVTGGFIESYNGETLTGEWLSDRDAYVSGGTPSTGAQVAYEIAQPYTFAVTPQYINLVDGLNYLWVVINGSTIRNDEYEGESISFTATDTTVITDFDVDFAPIQDGTPWQSSLMQVPYIFQRTPQLGHDYNKEFVNAIVGGTVAWNQLVRNGNFADTSNWNPLNGSISVSSNVCTFTVSGTQTYTALRQYPIGSIPLHKYLASMSVKSSKANTYSFYLGGTTVGTYTAQANTEKVVSTIFSTPSTISDDTLYCYMNRSGQLSNGDTVQVKNVMLIDLTALFSSSTIADYLYSLEQATAGAGVAKLKEWGFDIDSYHAYETGSLQSVNTSAHETVGKNQIESIVQGGVNGDGTFNSNANRVRTDYIKAIPSTNYSINAVATTTGKTPQFAIYYYDAKGGFISSRGWLGVPNTITTPPNCAKVVLGFRYSDNANVTPSNFSENQMEYGSIATDYEPYVKHSYPLDSDLTLRGIPKLDSSNNLYYDGDIYEPSGNVTRKYGVVDLGTLTWSASTAGSHKRFTSQTGVAKPAPTNTTLMPTVNSKGYISDTFEHIYSGINDKVVGISNGGAIAIIDSTYDSSDATAFKTAMSGQYLVFEKETPSTETADPFTAIQDVSPYGTEEYIDYGVEQGTRDIAVPVGHQSVYADIVPIYGWDEIKVYVSPTQDEQDATIYTIDLDGTRYGGTLNVRSGVLTVTRGYIEYDGSSDEPWEGYFNQGLSRLLAYVRLNAMKRRTDYAGYVTSNSLTSVSNVSGASSRDYSTSGYVNTNPNAYPGENWLYIRIDSSILTLADLRAWLSNNPVQIVYELATPIEVQLTPTEVQLLIGTNHIWSDEGNIVRLKTRTFGTDTANESIDVDYATTVQYDGIMCGNGIIPEVKM